MIFKAAEEQSCDLKFSYSFMCLIVSLFLIRCACILTYFLNFKTPIIGINFEKMREYHKLIHPHYSDVIMGTMAFQITSLTIVYSTVYSGGDQTKHQSFASLAFVRGIHRWSVNSPHKEQVTLKMFDDVIWMARLLVIWEPEHLELGHQQVLS